LNTQKNITDAHCPNDEPSDISKHGDFVWTVDPNNYDVKYELNRSSLLGAFAFMHLKTELFPKASFGTSNDFECEVCTSRFDERLKNHIY
jgi:hypothetical protein